MGSPPDENPLLPAASAVAGPADAALSYGQKAVDQGVDATKSTIEPLRSKPREQDPRVGALLRSTKRELDELTPMYNVLVSPNAHPDTGGREANEYTVKEYLSKRKELRGYLDAGVVGLIKEESYIVSWSECLFLTGDDRRAVANNLVVHYRGMLADERERLKDLGSTLGKHKQALDRVRKAMAEIKAAQAAIETLVLVYDGIEVVEKTTHAVAHGTVAVLPAQLSVVVAQSTIIKSGVAKLADYMTQLSIVIEGYTSVDDMKNAINASVKNIRDKVEQMRSYEDEKAKAERLYAIPAAGEKR